jgi:hypothetical protein
MTGKGESGVSLQEGKTQARKGGGGGGQGGGEGGKGGTWQTAVSPSAKKHVSRPTSSVSTWISPADN